MSFNDFRNTKMWRIFTTLIVLMFSVITIAAFAEVPPEPDEKQVVVSFAQTGNNLTVGALIGVPFEREKLNGYAVLSGQHIHDDGETDATQRLGYLEAGVPLRSFEFNGFVKALTNSERDLDRQIDYGYFIQLPKIRIERGQFGRRSWVFSAGFGNFARNEIAELEVDAHTSFNWKAFVRALHSSGLSLQFETTSAVDFSDPEYSLTPSTSIEVFDQVNVDLSAVIIHADERTHINSLIGVKLTF